MLARAFPGRHLLRLERGEEILDSLKRFAAREEIRAASLAGLGAVDKLVVGYYDLASREYKPREYTGQIEVLNLTGNISRRDGEPALHVHVTACREQDPAVGGHLIEGRVSLTLEMVVDLLDGEVARKMDEEVGLPLLDLPPWNPD